MTFDSHIRAVAVAVGILFAAMAPALALEQKAYDAADFKAAQDAGKAVIIHVTAPWCPTCTAQHTALTTLAKNPAFDAVTVYQVDFDTKADVWKGLNARSQSTLIAFSGTKETGRLAGETGVKPIEALLKSTLVK